MENNKYVQDEYGLVYKVMPDYILKLSPWEEGEDRRIFEQDLSSGYKVITYNNACMIVNNQFNNKTEKWEHKGKKYIASSISDDKDINEHTYQLSTLPNHKSVIKKTIKGSKKLLSQLPDGNTVSVTSEDGVSELKMVKHKGKVYYILIVNEFLPRVQAFNMFGEFVQWIGIKNCKPIFCETERRYV